MDTLVKWFGVITLLVLVYLVVANGQQSSQVIGSLSKANVNAIEALQGRTVSNL